MSQTIHGTVVKTYYSDAQFSAGVIATDDGTQVRFRGRLYAAEGDRLSAIGQWTVDPKYGHQFKIKQLDYELPQTREGLINYLSKHPAFVGVGQKSAERIVDVLADGEDLAEALRGRFDDFVAAGVPRKTLEALAESWNQHAGENAVRSYLAGFGLTPHQMQTLLDKFGTSIVSMLKHDPYLLIKHLAGYGFKKVDQIALKLGIAKTHPGRIEAALSYCVSQQISNGHTWTPGSELVTQANEALVIDTLDSRDLIQAAGNRLIASGDLIADGCAVTLPWLHRDEQLIEAALRRDQRADAEMPDELICHPDNDLSDDQREAFETAITSRVSVISGGAGTGKAQPVDAKVLTPKGWRRMGELKRGDKVIGANGRPCRVLAVYARGARDVYRVTMSDGATTECCDEHLWRTRSQRDRDRCRSEAVVPLHRIRQSLLQANGRRSHWIPMVAPVEFEGQPLPLDPYLMGLLLGDGCFRLQAGCSISTIDDDIVESVQSLLPETTALRRPAQGSIDYRICGLSNGRNNEVLSVLRKLGLHGLCSSAKFIPDIYKLARSGQRLALLQGLLDADGSASRHSIEFTTVSAQLADDVTFLVRSLGGTVSTASRVTSYTHRGERRTGQRSYRLHLCLPGFITPFRLPRKACHYLPATKYTPRRAIERVEYVGVKQVRCIAVDAPDHLYVTDDFIVTHNTYVVARLARRFQEAGHVVSLAAPTGKAAKRIEQLLRAHGVDLSASTIHRLLGYNGIEYREDILPADVVILDEVSMVDVPLMAELLRHINLQKTRLILVGDHNQLPPVGPGNVLRDLIQHNLVPATVMTKVHRQAGVLKTNSVGVLKGQLAPTATDDQSRWVVVNRFRDAHAIKHWLRDLVLTDIPNQYGFDPMHDVQIITPEHRGPLGTRSLNQMMQYLMLPEARSGDTSNDSKRGRPLPGAGDKVIQTRNDYDLGVMNGTIGFVRAVGKSGLVIDFEGKDDVEVDWNKAKSVDLAYALTAHKAQGSEFPCAVVLCHKSHFFADRNWLYTAVTRAAHTCVLVGDDYGLRRAAGQVRNIKRRTWLSLWASRAQQLQEAAA